MTVPVRTPLGASTTNRKWYLDVNTGTFGAPTWTPVSAITEFQPNFESGLEDDSDFDSEGYRSQTKTAEGWSVNATVVRKVTVADLTAYDAGQEYLRTKAIGKMGPANSADIRFYEMEPDGPRVEAYRGNASVGWAPNGGAMSALSTVAVTLAGQGKLTQIAHPDA